MDQNLVYAKTPIGDEAVRQRTRVARRNLRMVLVLVDGKMTVGELGAKLNDPSLVENALHELEQGGYIAPSLEAVSVWQESKLWLDQLKAPVGSSPSPRSLSQLDSPGASSRSSTFDRPILPAEVTTDVAGPTTHAASPRLRRLQLTYMGFGLIAVVLVTMAVFVFFPYDRFKPAIENELARIWQVPARVGGVRLILLPQPGLLLSDVRVGEGGESVFEKIRVHSLFAMLGSGVHSLSRIEILGGTVNADHLVGLSPADNGRRKSIQKWLMQQVVVENLSVAAGPLTLRQLSGEVSFRADGGIEKVFLQTVDNTLRVTAEPTLLGPRLMIEGFGWRPTDAPPVTFESLHATGLLQKGRLVVNSFDMQTFGGVLRGNWLVEWNQGLVMAGNATLERVDCRRMTALFVPSLALEGDLMGNFRLRGAGSDWDSMWASMDAALDAMVLRGVLNGVDLGEAARRGRGSTVRAGSTKFDRLKVNVTIDPRQIRGRNLAMNAGMFTATGQFVATRDRQVESSLQVTMQTSVSSLTQAVTVSGTLPNLQASVR
jgi:AsmA-like C-terminal region